MDWWKYYYRNPSDIVFCVEIIEVQSGSCFTEVVKWLPLYL